MAEALTKASQSPAAVPVDVEYTWGAGKHGLHTYQQVSADVLLVHQAKMVLFQLKHGTRAKAWSQEPVPLAARRMALRTA